jgi:hypothetical protein
VLVDDDERTMPPAGLESADRIDNCPIARFPRRAGEHDWKREWN